jgi:hypothetical protein
MTPLRDTPSAADVAAEAGGWAAGLGILTTVLFPFALPGLLLAAAPLIVLAVAGLILAAPVVLAVWLARAVARRLGGGTKTAASVAPGRGRRLPPGSTSPSY